MGDFDLIEGHDPKAEDEKLNASSKKAADAPPPKKAEDSKS